MAITESIMNIGTPTAMHVVQPTSFMGQSTQAQMEEKLVSGTISGVEYIGYLIEAHSIQILNRTLRFKAYVNSLRVYMSRALVHTDALPYGIRKANLTIDIGYKEYKHGYIGFDIKLHCVWTEFYAASMEPKHHTFIISDTTEDLVDQATAKVNTKLETLFLKYN